MKVKVGDKIYDGSEEPVMIIINDIEKKQIANLSEGKRKYCVYPGSEFWAQNNYARIKAWMAEE